MQSTVPEPVLPDAAEPLHVVAAIVRDRAGRVLIQKRPSGKVAAGLWEFPGGKVDAGEGRFEALQRELQEELGLEAISGTPLIRLTHQYQHATVDLDVWEVGGFRGRPVGLEGQEVRWAPEHALPEYDYPAANLPVVAAARLPDRMMVTAPPETSAGLVAEVSRAIQAGCRLVQFRAHALDDSQYAALAWELLAVCHDLGATLILNRDAEMLERIGADGLHYTEQRLRACHTRPVSTDHWFSASVHDAAGLEIATECGADFVALGPVRATQSHPGREPLGWEAFSALLKACALPVYAQGGMGLPELARARACGARGISGIRLFQAGHVPG